MLDNLNIEELTEHFFPGKFIFRPNLGKKDAEWAQNRIFGIFGKMFKNLKKSVMKTNIGIDISRAYLAYFVSQVMGQIDANQSNWMIL